MLYQFVFRISRGSSSKVCFLLHISLNQCSAATVLGNTNNAVFLFEGALLNTVLSYHDASVFEITLFLPRNLHHRWPLLQRWLFLVQNLTNVIIRLRVLHLAVLWFHEIVWAVFSYSNTTVTLGGCRKITLLGSFNWSMFLKFLSWSLVLHLEQEIGCIIRLWATFGFELLFRLYIYICGFDKATIYLHLRLVSSCVRIVWWLLVELNGSDDFGLSGTARVILFVDY